MTCAGTLGSTSAKWFLTVSNALDGWHPLTWDSLIQSNINCVCVCVVFVSPDLGSNVCMRMRVCVCGCERVCLIKSDREIERKRLTNRESMSTCVDVCVCVHKGEVHTYDHQ